jgi:hypothetical protein
LRIAKNVLAVGSYVTRNEWTPLTGGPRQQMSGGQQVTLRGSAASRAEARGVAPRSWRRGPNDVRLENGTWVSEVDWETAGHETVSVTLRHSYTVTQDDVKKRPVCREARSKGPYGAQVRRICIDMRGLVSLREENRPEWSRSCVSDRRSAGRAASYRVRIPRQRHIEGGRGFNGPGRSSGSATGSKGQGELRLRVRASLPS